MWLALRKCPRGSYGPGWRMCTFFRGSELPLVHLQLFQVCYQAKDSTVIDLGESQGLQLIHWVPPPPSQLALLTARAAASSRSMRATICFTPC